ncbi:MAG: alanine--tRNA ligase-related protein, partial [Acidimicrobiales bacterium]
MTEQLHLHDAYLRSFTARAEEVRSNDVRLDRTAFYPTGGGQPHDTGSLGLDTVVVAVWKEGDHVWHAVNGAVPRLGDDVTCTIDWDRRHALMRTHTALHVLCGVIWNEYKVAVTGGNMQPLSARMDFEFDPLPAGFGETIER